MKSPVFVAVACALACGAVPAAAQQPQAVPEVAPPAAKPAKPKVVNLRKASEKIGYKKVSSLVDFPDFYPGIGALYVRPATLPYGPFRSFDHQDRLVSTIYMVPLEEFNNHSTIDVKGVTGKVDHVTVYYNGGHPGVTMPHYHITIWHVSKKDEARVAK